MSLDDLRQYFVVTHIKEADERGVQVQMDAQKAKMPAWWPADVNDAITQAMLGVDLPALEYPFVKSCMSSPDAHALMALFQTPEGQTYINRATGAMVQAEANGASASAAKQEQMQKDPGVPSAALQRLSAPERQRVLRLLSSSAVNCMNNGFHQASVAVGQARTEAANKVVEEHRSELQAAKAKYDAAANTTASPSAPKERR